MFKLIEDTTYSVNDIDDILDEAIKNGIHNSNTKVQYWNIIFAFDIETSNFTEFRKGDSNNKRSIMYIWQLAINGRVVIGREWSEFLYAIDHIIERLELMKDKRIIIYVHNLAFEFQYIRKFFQWEKVFAIDTRKPIYAITKQGVEFRCSYILTNYSLEKLADQLQVYHVRKMVGDLDYSKVRTPLTPLTDEEMQYCINDVLVVSAYIKEAKDKEGSIARIPLTCTGYCRRYVRHNCLYSGGKQKKKDQFNKYHTLMLSMKIGSIEEYEQLKRAFQGGFTHAAKDYSGMTCEHVSSLDFTSSYPYALLSEPNYPVSCGKLVTIHSKDELEYYLKNYCCLFDCKFHDIKATFTQENYISISKCPIKIRPVVNNGRLYSADLIGTTLTNIDFDIIRKTYSFSKCDIYNFRIYKKGYLPKEIITSIIKLYQDKTTLKGVKGKETEYLNSKGLLNSIYGMMVTDIIRDIIGYDNEEEWNTKPCESEKELKRYNNSRRRFNYYPWGIWCTALSRRNLWYGIAEFGKTDDYIYSDTDSVKVLHMEDHKEFIDTYNKLCEKKLKAMCKHYDIPYEELLPKTIKGETKPLGVWDYEGTYDRFKTLGAKRYMVQEGNKLSITVSGVNKKTAVPYLLDEHTIEECFEIFTEGLVIPAENTGKLTHYYIDKPYKGTVKDFQGVKYEYTALSGIYLEGAEYHFDISEEYLDFLKGVFYTK